MRLVVALALAAIAVLAPTAGAATITVTTQDDVTADDGRCSLREAIGAANADATSGATAGECPAGLDADTIDVPPGTFAVGVVGNLGTQDNVAGDFDVLGPLTIAGAGAGQTAIVGAAGDRVFDLVTLGPVTLSGLTITAGNPGLVAGLIGGGIRSETNTLTIRDCVISGNRISDGPDGAPKSGATGGPSLPGGNATGDPGIDGGLGGGIVATGDVLIQRTVIVDNHAGDGGDGGAGTGGQGGSSGANGGVGSGGAPGMGGTGGGIAVLGDGSLTIVDSTIRANSSGDGGDGGAGIGGNAGLASSTGTGGNGGAGSGASGGQAGYGGGVFVSVAELTISGSTISQNSTGSGGNGGNATGGNGSGGGDQRDGGVGGNASGGDAGIGGAGGGIRANGAVTITNSTIHQNATGAGGAGGSGSGGDGGNGGNVVNFIGGAGGDAGNAGGGPGGAGGSGAALDATGPAPISVTHATISSNTAGAGGAGGAAAAGTAGIGTGGEPNGDAGFPNPGGSGAAGSGGIRAPAGGALNNTIHVSSACTGGAFTGASGSVTFNTQGCPGIDADPKLGALADNGGPTQTRAPEPGSAAIDAVTTQCAATDQRGVARPQLGGCDSGAFEVALPGVTTGDATAITANAATLNGTVVPNGAVSVFFEFGQTDGYGSQTPAIDPGRAVTGTPVSAALTALAPGTIFHYRLVATSPHGTVYGADRTFTTTAGTGVDTAAPSFASASLKPKRFRVDRQGAAETPVAAARKGTRIRYSLSEAARVVFTVQRARPGRRVGKKCRKPSGANRARKRCTRYTRAGRFAHASTAGANEKRFSGRIGKRALKRGRYRMRLVATDAAGNRSKPRTLKFRVVRR